MKGFEMASKTMGMEFRTVAVRVCQVGIDAVIAVVGAGYAVQSVSDGRSGANVAIGIAFSALGAGMAINTVRRWRRQAPPSSSNG
jgi:hypothetical protein